MNVLVLYKAKDRDKKIISRILSNLAAIHYYYEENVDLRDIDVILTGSGRELKEDIINSCQNLKFIQLLAAGADLVPYDKLPNDVIVATNAGGNAIPVAEHAITLMLAALKNLVYHNEKMKKGTWDRYAYGRLLYGKKIGIIGFGEIGCELARLLQPFNVRILAINRSGKTKCPEIKIEHLDTIRSLDYVLSESDIVVLILPLTNETRGLINKEKLSLMKKDAILINVGRGPVIVEEDLYQHLIKNKDFIAALDVWWHYPREPKSENFYQKYPFHELENIIMTPHIAGFTDELREKVIEHAVKNIRKFIETGEPNNIVDRSLYI